MLAGAVALFLALVAGSAHADGLFLPVAAQDAPAMPATSSGLSAQPRGSDRQGAWERHVRIARPFLDDARDDVQRGRGRLLLNVRPGASLDVFVERTTRIKRGYTLSGRIEGDAVGFVTLVAHEDAVAASIWTPHAAYELSYLGDGVHALRDVTNAPPLRCGGALPAELPMAEAATQGGTDNGSVVDILVVWTPAAEERYGGELQVLSTIDMSIAYTNDAFERSGAIVSLRLVGAERVDYQEAESLHDDLTRLREPDDGHMDGVHDQRDALGADLVYLLATPRDASGVTGFSNPFAVGADAIVFAHEVGHQFGIAHERLEDFLINGVRSYRHGFTTEGCNVSIVSYGEECFGYAGRHLPFYASPWRYGPRDGRPLGVSRFSRKRTARGPADAVLTANRNRHRVANYRPSRGGSKR